VLFYFGLGVIVARGRRGLRDTAPVGVNVVVTLLAALLTAFFRALRERGERDQQTKC
jgi:hypothetical protein